MCQDKGTPRFRLVEVQVDSVAKNKFSLKDEEVLRNCKRIIAIEAYKVANVSVAPTNQAPVVNATVFNKSFLVLSTPGTDQVQYDVPFISMDKTSNQGQLYRVDIPPIAPTKCFIEVATTAGLVLNEVFLLGFHYES